MRCRALNSASALTAYQVLAVVEDPRHRQVDDVGLVEAVHLGLLERGHPPGRGQHHHAHPVAPLQRMLRRGPGVAGGGAEDGEGFAAPRQLVGEQLPQQLHRHVLEGGGRAVAEMRQPHPVGQPGHGDDGGVEVLLRCVGALADAPQVIGGDVVDEQGAHLEGEGRIALVGEEVTPSGEGGLVDDRVIDGQVEPAVGGQPLQEDVAEAPVVTARGSCGDVSHAPDSTALRPHLSMSRRWKSHIVIGVSIPSTSRQ